MADIIKILTIKNQVEASLLDEILKEREIPHIIRSYRDLAYNGLWQTPTAWGQLDAPEEFKEQILKLYEEMSLPENFSEDIQ
ncbi:MAG TPA: hypothetical protein PLP03_03530 [Bacteroidales bacterium]|jgi:hypothetical protein|nr:hypothetical protein [Bacteroidales bacterium]